MRWCVDKIGRRLAVLVVAAIWSPLSVHAAAAHVVISELQTGTAASASQEFVELYNPTGVAVSLDGWALEYKSATSPDSATYWVKHAGLAGSIPAYGFYLAAPQSYLSSADVDWAAGLAASAGNVRLIAADGMVIDQVGYGDTANAAEGGQPAAAPAVGQSLERLPGVLDELRGNGTDSDVNALDFVRRAVPQPQSALSPIEMPADLATLANNGAPEAPLMIDPVAADPPTYGLVELSELLVNPMAPLTDDADEFIELHNPTDQTVDVAGYQLRTGSNFHESYTLSSLLLPPDGYVSLSSSQTGLALPNSGGAAEILDPSGAVLDATPPYAAAPEGQAWARFDDGWRWTLQLTPGRANILAVAVNLSPAVKSALKTAAKPAAKPVSKTGAKTSKAKPATKSKAVKQAKTTKPKSAKPSPQLAAARSLQPATWLLIGLAALTIGYALYEFRYDFQALYYRCFRDPTARPDHRPADQKGGDH